jgi:hypothetical protein
MSKFEKVGEAAILYVKFQIIVFALFMVLGGILAVAS